ncbi:MAG: tetratricopeptide repeat protein [Calditrichia bacterium]
MFRLFVLPIILQVLCIVHVVRNGRGNFWILIIIFLPLAGSIAYIIIEIAIPYFSNPRVKQYSKSILKSKNPEKELKRLLEEYQHSNTLDNKIALAEGYVACGDYEKAISLYDESLSGIYKDDPDIKYKLAAAYYESKDYDAAKVILEKLVNSENKNSVVWLSYIHTLEKLGEQERALEEFKKYIKSFSNLEALCRYGYFLQRAEKHELAKEQFSRVLNEVKHLPKFNLREQKAWLKVAQKELAAYKKQGNGMQEPGGS